MFSDVSINSTSTNRSDIRVGKAAAGLGKSTMFPLIPLLRIEATQGVSKKLANVWPGVSINSTSTNRSDLKRKTRMSINTSVSINSTSTNRSDLNLNNCIALFVKKVFPLIPLLRIEATRLLNQGGSCSLTSCFH